MPERVILNKGLVSNPDNMIFIPKGKNLPHGKCDIFVFLEDTEIIIKNNYHYFPRRNQFLPICALVYRQFITTEDTWLKMLYLKKEYRDKLLLLPGYIEFGYDYMLIYNGISIVRTTKSYCEHNDYVLKPSIAPLIVLYCSIKLIVWSRRFLHNYYSPEGKGAQKILKVLSKT